MRKSLVAALLFLGVAVSTANFALARDGVFDPIQGEKLINAQMNQELRSSAARLGTSTNSPQNTDTTWIGYTPGHKTASNYWSIYSGHGKDGYARPINGQTTNGMWTWEEPINGDSLQGWWPIHLRYFGGVGTFGDRARPCTAIDIGNSANYVINQANGRTFGVVGVWHVDGGSTVASNGDGPSPNWAPSLGAGAAWMGLRSHGDTTHQDGKTGNYFNEDVLQYSQILPVSPGGNDYAFPGYGSQMDQMLYRDIDFQGKKTSGLTVTFKYRSVMSLNAGSTVATLTGWYDSDPLGDVSAPNSQLNNFISASDNPATAPCDSFMVYVGSGVDGNQWLGSDGVLHDVYDPQRRWFGEVLHWDRDPGSNPLNPQPLYYKQLLSAAGDNPADAATNPTSYSSQTFTIPTATLAPFLAKNNKIRLVFRVKTNRNSADDRVDYSSNRAGAVVVDEVTYQIGANPVVPFGNFDSASEIDNSTSVSALDAWKSTGKPPTIYHHTHLFSSLTYADICGQKGDAGRLCDMTGIVISSGDHDRNEHTNGTIGTAEFDRIEGFISPVISFAGFDPITHVNAMGLRDPAFTPSGIGDTEASEDYWLWYDIYTGVYNQAQTANFWEFGFKSYPGLSKGDPAGYPAWGQIKVFGFIIFNPDVQCLPDIEPLGGGGLVDTSNPSGIPDSCQVYLGKFTRCFRQGLSTNCGRDNGSPTGGSYFDDVSLAIVDGIPQQMNVDIWMWYNDAFPANESAGFPGNKALYDTTTAWIKNGLNTSQFTSNKARRNVPGDSVWINTSSTTARVDMVFRVLPGPGNYQPIGQGHSGNLRKVPTNPATVVANDNTWWDVFRRIPGEFSTNPGGMTNLKAGWNPNFWLSARCDTAENNLYAFQGRGVLGGPVEDTDYMSTWHESDSRYNTLGIDHFICFVRCSTCALQDIECNGTVPTDNNPGGYLPVGTAGVTKEGSKIIRDGLLTPGAHVEYFFRDQKDSEVPDLVNFALLPDTTTVFPQGGEGSTDGHRWQEFSVLPDRWKDPQYVHPVFQTNGRGPACLLVIDNNDRRGNERVWVSVADTIGATHPDKFGAHNGWHAAGNVNQGTGVGVNDPIYRVARHGGSPGTTWDMFQVKASESSTTGGGLGGRLADRSGLPVIADKSARIGPTPEVLEAYYTLMLILTGDLNSNIFGPFKDRGGNESALIKGWLLSGNTAVQDRGIWAVGDGFVESNFFEAGGNGEQQDLLATYFGVTLTDPNYAIAFGNVETPLDLRVFPEWQGKKTGAIQTYGVRNVCLWTNDVLELFGAGLTLGSIASEYDKKSAPGTVSAPASVFKDWDPTSPWKALVDGWDIEHLTSRNDRNTVNRSAYFFKIFSNVWAKIWNVTGTPVVPLDVQSFDEGALVNFVNLKNNPLKQGSATFVLGLAKSDHVEVKMYDVTGRLVRTLADREFTAGSHPLVWDGVDNAGRQVARGVYFAQVKYRTAGIKMAKQLVVLK